MSQWAIVCNQLFFYIYYQIVQIQEGNSGQVDLNDLEAKLQVCYVFFKLLIIAQL